MFARTERLTLRPFWPEDATALAGAIDHPAVARMLLRVPSPYTAADAEYWARLSRPSDEPCFAIETHETPRPTLVGGIAIAPEADGPNLGYWLTPAWWGRGYATEAGRAIVDIARHALGIRRLHGRHFVDNPDSGRVLRKLGFQPTGTSGTMTSLARAEPAASVGYVLDLDARRLPRPIAA